MVIGDIILDRYITGSVERISPEAPVQVFEVASEKVVLGGAANVAANVKGLGADVWLVGVVGRDEDAKLVRSALKKLKIKSDGLVTDRSRPTTRKTRLMALRQQMLRVDREKRHYISEEIGGKISGKIGKYITSCGGVIVSDYGKGALPPRLLKRIFSICRKAGKQVIVDPKGRDYSRYKGATMITPNKTEASLATGVDIHDDNDYQEAARRIFEISKVKKMVITRGAEGMSVFDTPGAGMRLEAEALEVFDVTGAGDTVIAALGTFMFYGAKLHDAARLANVAAAIEVGHIGARAVTIEEIASSLARREAVIGKIMNRSQAAYFSERCHLQNKKVVFTNGCFDLLHPGHVKLLRQASAFGDYLIVGLNTDSSIRRLKGENRPVLEEADRLEMLSALDCVDAVVLFGEDTPLRLIKAVKPDVLVKGSEYKINDIVGRDIVEDGGGRVERVPLLRGKSTTDLIEKIRNSHGKGNKA